ncbi:MAG TPA: PaaX family transcriptional regulator C-terminal domain-containing protein [Intrasporangium sp.]|uniref:PaaX family transcriptional regulator n=1 Tax=Intrasporangium sp. TaxID=1925024 RepID=UPI002D77FBCB|nr:PaaX family transcriptional regulator C-terminal domain-containing protein [Intrasporangium sp.]HET7399877.1 PaaX family transcriptional regulator C-terminal domain-containing protein [Intrasporangium sp.]
MTPGRTEGSGSARYRAASGSVTPGSARSLLFTILGELVWPTGGPVRTATLVHILNGLGIEEQTARQAIARASASDWIQAERHGREVSWSLTPKVLDIFVTGSARVYSLSRPYEDWDGRWLAVMPTIPQSRRTARRPLYAGLTWAGFGDPAPGLWLSPHVERADEVNWLIKELDLTEHTVSIAGTVESIGISQADIVRRGWDLDALRRKYEHVLERIEGFRPKGSEETLLTHVRAMNEWQEFPRTDPQLPEALLPDWVGRQVARRIEHLRAQWTPVTRQRYAEINGG